MLIVEINVIATKLFKKQLWKSPVQIKEAVDAWLFTLGQVGLVETRKIKSYHDEPLQGDRFGQRSIRLNKAYRLFYSIHKENEKIYLRLLEVNKHEY